MIAKSGYIKTKHSIQFRMNNTKINYYVHIICVFRALSPISNYLPSKKIRSFVTTFTEVTNFRLDNLYTRLLPSNWTEWCNEHYSCDETKKNYKI